MGLQFDIFFEQSRPEMLARALMLSCSRHDAEDAVQEAYVEALSRWDRISGYDNPGAWVYKIVRQRLWKASKRWQRLSSLSAAEVTAWQAEEGDPEQFAEAVLVLTALARLPDRQRMVMVMHCLQRIEQQQIADELGLSRGAVAASIFKARRKLEKALGMKHTELATMEHPSSSIVTSGEGPLGDSAIMGERDPLVISLRTVMLRLLQRAAQDGGASWLAQVHRAARPDNRGQPA